MPQGEGYFLSPSGEVLSVFEHLMAVEDAPARFGLKPEDVVAQNEEERRNRNVRRERVLALVLKNGFCRVRFWKGNSVQFHADGQEEEARKLAMIDGFLRRKCIETCRVHNICSGKAITWSAEKGACQ